LYDTVDEAVLHSSLVCLVITSQSEYSLHPSLTEVQGSHLIQGFAQRAEILHHLILRKTFLSEETLKDLDLEAVAKKTEGYTAQDLSVLLERAIHANTMQRGHSDQGMYREDTSDQGCGQRQRYELHQHQGNLDICLHSLKAFSLVSVRACSHQPSRSNRPSPAETRTTGQVPLLPASRSGV
ncbi:hypothetical protein XENOCAPTIV_030848, partial [Xenoophorus captivus]